VKTCKKKLLFSSNLLSLLKLTLLLNAGKKIILDLILVDKLVYSKDIGNLPGKKD